jgi:hypothetical protein
MAAFTTIAAGIGLAATAGTTTMSFVQAGKQKQAQRNAERDAAEAMQEARKKLEVNVYDKLSIQKEPYELEREALLSQGAQAIQAGVESERGAAATAGRIQMAQQEGQAGIRTAMGQDLMGLERLSAQEEGRLRDIGMQLDLEEVAGAQLAAANAAELGAQATQQGFEGVTSMAGQLASMAPLYEKSAGARQLGRIEDMGKRQGMTPEQIQQQISGLGTIGGVDYGKVGSMNRFQYQDFMGKQSGDALRNLRQQGLNMYGFNPFQPSTYKKLF